MVLSPADISPLDFPFELVDVCDLGVVLQRVVKYVLIYDGVSLSSGDLVVVGRCM